MKKLLLALLLFTSICTFAQTGVYGWTVGLTTAQAHLYKNAGYKGVRVILKWDDLQTTSTDHSMTLLKNVIKIATDSSLNLEVQIWVGPDAPINNPVNWLRVLGVDTFYTHGGSSDGPWPDYYDSIYKARFNILHKDVADTLHNMYGRGKITKKLSVFVSNGSTGDGQPYKGDADVSSFGIFNDDTWSEYKKRQWDSTYHYYAQDTAFMRTTYQPEDAANYLLYIWDSLPYSYMKKGTPTHEIPSDGQSWRKAWPNRVGMVYLGEIDAYMKFTPYPWQRTQEMFEILDARVNRADFMSPWWDTIAHRDTIVAMFNKYSDQFFVANSQVKRGFCALADKINFRDTIEYPTAIYGQLYDSYKTYLLQIHAIDVGVDSNNIYRKQVRYTGTAENRADSMRFVKLDSLLDLERHEFGPFEHNDICFDCNPNYSLWITQKEPQKTSKGKYRIGGDVNSIYGRNARIFKNYNSKYEMYFSLNDTLSSGNTVSGILTDSIRFKITYLDSGTGRWNVFYSPCASHSVTNTNSMTFKQETFTVSKFQFPNRLPYGSNLEFQLIDADKNFPICLIEAEVLSK